MRLCGTDPFPFRLTAKAPKEQYDNILGLTLQKDPFFYRSAGGLRRLVNGNSPAGRRGSHEVFVRFRDWAGF